MTDSLDKLRQMALSEPYYWQSGRTNDIYSSATVEQLSQRYVLMPAHVKDGYLLRILSIHHDQQQQQATTGRRTSSTMIFVNTCRTCQLLAMTLRELGFPCLALHSMCHQQERLHTLAQFKSSRVNILVATDVASRGLDIPTVDVVINYDLPREPRNYVHRVGRTARAGRKGLALSLVTQHDIRLLKAIEEKIKCKLTEHKVSEREVLKTLTEIAVTKSECEIKLDEVDFGEREQIYKRKKLILQGKTPEQADAIIEEDKARKKRWSDPSALGKSPAGIVKSDLLERQSGDGSNKGGDHGDTSGSSPRGTEDVKTVLKRRRASDKKTTKLTAGKLKKKKKTEKL